LLVLVLVLVLVAPAADSALALQRMGAAAPYAARP
jgi:hypothetical protein